MPRWAASMRLPKPTIVVSPFTNTAMMVERATSGPPWSRPSMKRMTMLRPNSAAAPQHQEGQHGHQHDGVHRPLLVRALHEPDRLVGDDRGARHVAVHRAQV